MVSEGVLQPRPFTPTYLTGNPPHDLLIIRLCLRRYVSESL
jgi:hypothetical protein